MMMMIMMKKMMMVRIFTIVILLKIITFQFKITKKRYFSSKFLILNNNHTYNYNGLKTSKI